MFFFFIFFLFQRVDILMKKKLSYFYFVRHINKGQLNGWMGGWIDVILLAYKNKIKYLPPILALYATPTPQQLLKATAATSPAHLVPCLLSPLSWGIGSESFPLMSYEASGSCKIKKIKLLLVSSSFYFIIKIVPQDSYKKKGVR